MSPWCLPPREFSACSFHHETLLPYPIKATCAIGYAGVCALKEDAVIDSSCTKSAMLPLSGKDHVRPKLRLNLQHFLTRPHFVRPFLLLLWSCCTFSQSKATCLGCWLSYHCELHPIFLLAHPANRPVAAAPAHGPKLHPSRPPGPQILFVSCKIYHTMTH